MYAPAARRGSASPAGSAGRWCVVRRARVKIARGRIGADARPAAGALLRLAREAGWVTRAWAVQAVGRIPCDGSEVCAAVQRLTADPVEAVRPSARIPAARLGSADRGARDDTRWLARIDLPIECGAAAVPDHGEFCTRRR